MDERENLQQNLRKNRGGRRIGFALFVLLVCILCGVTAVYAYRLHLKHKTLQADYKNLEENKNAIVAAEVEEQIELVKAEEREAVMDEFRAGLGKEQNTLKFLREVYGEDYLVYQQSSNYLFRPLLKVAMADYSDGAFVKDDKTGLYSYEKDGERVTKHVVDVSKYQGTIDWKAVKEFGIEGAIIRAGVRGYGSGEIVADATFDNNMKGALAQDLSVGAYFFSEAITVDEAKEEAEFMINALKPYKISLPVVLDLELIEGDEGRNEKLSKKEMTEVALTFMEAIEEAGFDAMLYGNIDTISDMVDLTKFADYKLWFAYYSDNIYVPYKVDMWQYASDGKVAGIETDCDVNMMFTE